MSNPNGKKGAACVMCGAHLATVGPTSTPRKYCGTDCMNAARRERYVSRSRQNPPSLEERLWARVEKLSNGCWEWRGYRMPYGYGQIGLERGGGRTTTTHRAAWLLTHGDPGELHVLHRCDNPPCCNPDHLFLGTNADNAQDKASKGRAPSGFAMAHTRLSDADVDHVRRTYRRPKRGDRGNSRELAALYGVTANYITAVAARRERADV